MTAIAKFPAPAEQRLSELEGSRLAACEEQIQAGLNAFLGVADALLIVREERLYRQTHSTFEDYCRERWGMARSTAYQYVDAAEVVKNVPNCGHEPPTNEAQARALAKLPPEEQASAWQEALATVPGGKVTAAHIKRVDADRRAAPKRQEEPEHEAPVIRRDTPEVGESSNGGAPTPQLNAAPPDETSAQEVPPWAGFDTRMRGVISMIRGASRELREVLEVDDSKRIGARFGYWYSHQGTVYALNQIASALEENLPAELCNEPPGYIPTRKVKEREAISKRRGRD